MFRRNKRIAPILALSAVGLLASCLAGAEASVILARPSACAVEFESRAARVMKRRGLPRASTFFPPGEAARQELRFPSSLCPDRALAMAVETLLHAEGPESFTAVHQEMGAEICSRHCFLNRQSTLWGIVGDEESALEYQLLPQAPGRISLRSHWIFFVSVSDLSEHGYWAVVARDGSELTWLSEN